MAQYETIKYANQTVKVAKIPKATFSIRGSVDGRQYGTSGDKRLPKEFGDSIAGYTEEIISNGGLFYSWENDTFSVGLELSKGVNNQDASMSAVYDYNEVMAVGFPHVGGVEFRKQKDIISNLSDYYGAVTFAFGIMKNGAKEEWGKAENSSQYNCVSGRTILGQNDDFVFVLSIAGTTGKSGLKGSVLFDLCKKLGMKDAGCFDGGGSVFLKVNGAFKNTTTRKVKNAVILFSKPIQSDYKPQDELKEDDGVIGCSMRFQVVHGAYGTAKCKVATRSSAKAKYDTKYPVYVGDVFTVDELVSDGEYYIGHMTDGSQPNRWVLLDPSDIIQID